MKIVSLLPAATEIVCALGLGDRLVGRSHECDFPPEVQALPPLTRARVDSSLPSGRLDDEVRAILEAGLPLYELDVDRLAALEPDVVVTQEACEVCAVSYEQVVDALAAVRRRSRVISLRPSRLEHILGDVRTVAEACDQAERGEAAVRGLEERLRAVAARPLSPRPRVAVIEWLDPPMLAGHWVPDAVSAAGGDPVGPLAGTPSPYSSWEDVRSLEADAIVIASCGFDLPRTLREAGAAKEMLRSLAPRVLALDGNAYLNRPGPRIVEAIEVLAAWLRGAPLPADRAVAL